MEELHFADPPPHMRKESDLCDYLNFSVLVRTHVKPIFDFEVMTILEHFNWSTPAAPRDEYEFFSVIMLMGNTCRGSQGP